jgi:hypothetical protein
MMSGDSPAKRGSNHLRQDKILFHEVGALRDGEPISRADVFGRVA